MTGHAGHSEPTAIKPTPEPEFIEDTEKEPTVSFTVIITTKAGDTLKVNMAYPVARDLMQAYQRVEPTCLNGTFLFEHQSGIGVIDLLAVTSINALTGSKKVNIHLLRDLN